MDTVSYPDARLNAVVGERAVPVRLNIMKERDAAKRLGARWTPTVIFLDADGREHHRFLGFLPPDEYAAQVHLAAGHATFAAGRFEDAEAAFRRVVDDHPRADAAPEALYWSGVARFKITKSTQPIYDACKAVVERYPGHLWAKKVGFVARYKDFNLS